LVIAKQAAFLTSDRLLLNTGRAARAVNTDCAKAALNIGVETDMPGPGIVAVIMA
jgi:hypothetical protein